MNLFSNKYTNKIYNNKTIHKIFNNNCYSEKYLLYLYFKIKQKMILTIFLVIVIIINSIPILMYIIEYIILYRFKKEEPSMSDILFNKYISGQISFSEFILERNKYDEQYKKQTFNRIRKQKLKKLNRKSLWNFY